ncbi:MAG: TonB-dependent receptor plug domain-containing protein [Proteobacteria bacterium]|nr:TonB-dependent receptor plug domain-containing protein [Pseudomonadota bacterium]
MLNQKRATFIAALLMTTAYTAPAFAEIEVVTVTTERKVENIQNTPVAVTALSGDDLKSKQVSTFKDLQFHVPSVTYTKSNFGGAQFQIRGITTQFGLGAAIAQNENDIYLEAPALVNGQYFDVDRVEVARGPQSTSYGRAATGGAVNIITSKPDLDQFAARASLDYGTYNTFKPEMMVNIPIIEGELGVRFAALGVWHDGYEKNDYSGPAILQGGLADKKINGQGTASGRFSIRWEPSADTTIDFVAEAGTENDNRVRGDKQLCHRDPSGVLGCLPDQLKAEPLNVLSTLGATLGSKQGITALLNLSFGVSNFGQAQALGNALGLFQLAGNGGAGDPAGPVVGQSFLGYTTNPLGPYVTPSGIPGVYALKPQPVNGYGSGAGGVVSKDLLTANTAFNPVFKGSNQTYMMNWSQTITSWLKSTLDVGYASTYQFTQQNYNDSTPENISSAINASVAGFMGLFGNGAGTPGVINNANGSGAYNAYFAAGGTLPISNTFYNGKFGSYAGIIDQAHGILANTPYFAAYDEDNFSSREWTGELRFQTAFDGPLNFSAGAFWMSYDGRNQYWVASNGLDWESIAIGAFAGSGAGPGGIDLPLMAANPTFDSEHRRGAVQSRSMFLEGTYEFTDNLRVIVGARYNDDRSSALSTPIQGQPLYPGGPIASVGGGLLLTNGFALVGTQSCTANGGLAAPGCVGYPGVFRLPTGLTGKQNSVTDKWTGRATIQWEPHLSWTDQTQVYATASRGELAGGINKANNAAALGIPTEYNPATVDAIEVGTKNTLLDGSLQANLDVWYYNYENYQVGIISNRQALTLNIPAHLYGLEGEFVWQPDDDLAFNLTLSLTRSQAGTAYLVDQRNPTNGQANSILVKDLTNGSLCVVVPTDPATVGHTPGDSSTVAPNTIGAHVNNFYLPNGGNAAVDAPYGVPLVNYGVCNTALAPALAAAGYAYSTSVDPKTGLSTGIADGNGIARNIHGNKLPQVPNAQVGFGAQYTFHFDEYTLVPRLDYYWQSSMQARVMNDPGSDYIGAWDTLNGQIQLNAPDDKWYAKVFATNIFDKHNPTGEYLTDPTSALFTNVFAEDPRVVGISVGAKW